MSRNEEISEYMVPVSSEMKTNTVHMGTSQSKENGLYLGSNEVDSQIKFFGVVDSQGTVPIAYYK